MSSSLPYSTGLYFITDRRVSGRTPEDMTLAAVKAGVRWVQYREKEKSRRDIYQDAAKLRRITADYRATFIVNDHADIALAVDADGVHLGQDDLPLKEARKVMGERIIGISTHSLKEAQAAAAGGADYIGFGPLFPTKTKDAGTPRGIEKLMQVRGEVSLPVVAIGGIATENLRSVLDAGADAVAVASAILIGDIAVNVAAFLRVLGEDAKRGRSPEELPGE
ncbi:MAG TPA: thiamine phosphate synthase [Thermodesulfovibrionales bacterium]|nr:thiamine phosphate synthase [Thermodesulfovibrionales bacterium]